MTAPDQRYRDAVLAGAEAMGLELDAATAEQMAIHHALLERWARKTNLTTVVDPARAAIVHGLDSLLFAELIAADDRARAVDVGSGAGFPGVILGLTRPQLALTLMEPQRKRASFLRVVLAELGLARVAVEERRLEPTGPALDAELLVSRATIPPLELLELAPRHVVAGGRLVLSGGAGFPEEAALQAAAEPCFRLHPERRYTLPGGERRVLRVAERVPGVDHPAPRR